MALGLEEVHQRFRHRRWQCGLYTHPHTVFSLLCPLLLMTLSMTFHPICDQSCGLLTLQILDQRTPLVFPYTILLQLSGHQLLRHLVCNASQQDIPSVARERRAKANTLCFGQESSAFVLQICKKPQRRMDHLE